MSEQDQGNLGRRSRNRATTSSATCRMERATARTRASGTSRFPNRQRRALGALFVLLALGFAGIAAAAAASGATALVRIVIALAAAALAIWLGSLAARALR